jgi:lipoprotein-anchoring transpeptidase ErfK/SrfK
MRMRLLLAWIAGVMVVITGCSTTGGKSGVTPQPQVAPIATTSSTAPPPLTTPPPSSVPPSSSTPPSPTAPPKATTQRPTTPPSHRRVTLLEFGDRGPAVAALQTQLIRLGYWLGAADGSFGMTTQQAVYALQKAAGLTPDGVYGPKTAAALKKGVLPHVRSASGHVIEVNLTSDLLMIVNGGKIAAVLNTSTGGGYTYTSDGVTAVAHTPTGQFRIYRSVDGMDISPLGELWRPRYFYGGYAIHGSNSVPPYPVSHGCVRLSNPAIDWIWAAGQAPFGTEVMVYY